MNGAQKKQARQTLFAAPVSWSERSIAVVKNTRRLFLASRQVADADGLGYDGDADTRFEKLLHALLDLAAVDLRFRLEKEREDIFPI